MKNNLFPISKEGWNYIAYAVVLFLVLGFLDLEFLQFFAFVGIMFFIYIYRNPERQIMALEKGGVVSPVDGNVSDLQEDKNSTILTIESSYHDVSVLRVPISCVVKNIKAIRGSSLGKNSSKSEILNEKLTIDFEDEQKRVISISHLSTLNFANISHDLSESQKLIQGFRYGVMPKGITKIILPKGSKVNVNIGDELKGCESIIAYLS
ncbi:phosphatidylserine decarboxylase [Sulfurimonas sp.]|uniref:phosphatidylserine decarboxylase n=1 Tax=Sulfurimonas sp. TaxID=2022749 RepID=UPI0035631549